MPIVIRVIYAFILMHYLVQNTSRCLCRDDASQILNYKKLTFKRQKLAFYI